MAGSHLGVSQQLGFCGGTFLFEILSSGARGGCDKACVCVNTAKCQLSLAPPVQRPEGSIRGWGQAGLPPLCLQPFASCARISPKWQPPCTEMGGEWRGALSYPEQPQVPRELPCPLEQGQPPGSWAAKPPPGLPTGAGQGGLTRFCGPTETSAALPARLPVAWAREPGERPGGMSAPPSQNKMAAGRRFQET